MICRNYLLAVFLLGLSFLLPAQDAWNVDLFGQINRGDTRYSGCWSYVAPGGAEYALIGARTGTAVYPIDDPMNIIEVGFVPGPVTNWREITTIGHYAFVVTDVSGTGHGMQVIDLSFLPDSLHLVTTYTETFTTAHIIQKAIDNDEPYVYVMGSSLTQGVHILDVSDPANPVEIGFYQPGYYIHDCHVRGNLLFAAALYNKEFDIVDISDKTNPVLVGKVTYDGKNTHSSSTSEDGKYLITADEADGFPGRVFDITDIENPVEVARFTANPASLVHNPYVRGDFCFVSHNTEGLRVLDIADPELPVEVGFYDTWNDASGGFNGLWSACPYFPSGKIIGGNRHNGLYIWTFNNTKAARIYGVVVDSLTGNPLPDAVIEIPSLTDTLTSNANGQFKKGMLAGDYSLTVSVPGFLSKTIDFSLAQGDSLWLEIPLAGEDLTAIPAHLENFSNLRMYPNPVHGTVKIDFHNLDSATKLIFFNHAGQVVYTYNISGEKSLILAPGSILPGTYQVAVFDHQDYLLAISRLAVL